ncbi:hypothetical protein [Streptomyces sp. ISL-11]|uniref:hypothetical protein n=1 Tax=Streptomyces sp. ISL-11 TaxID=2819174 RepID=UPI001BE8C037|nr:hypothetical protein [Streptomyces sp. ISL-11]MBT2387085.1 hypothetical protein [Streptomyces sp. ISL-11]
MSAARGRPGTGPEPEGRWLTLPDCKRVLVVVHTVTYGQRLREVFALLEGDLRIQVAFTVAPHALGEGAARFLRELGVAVLPWKSAARTGFDLALAAGSRGIERVRGPLIRLSHGAGHIKLLREDHAPAEPAAERPAGMLSRQYLTRGGRVVPAAIALAHERDVAELRRWCPEAVPVAAVVGDPDRDRLAASLPHREAYRRALGVGARQQLVAVTTTWGPSSSFGRFDALLPRLLGELPPDRYRVAVLVHPNVWAGHGDWQIRTWLAGCRARGLTLVPPGTDWRAVLVAADYVIGDHGSLTSYATVTPAPVLVARFPEREVHPASPAAALALAAPALSPLHPLEDQLRYAAAEYRRPEYARVAALLSSEPGRFNRRMRALMYRLLGLGQPAYAPVTEPAAVPPPLERPAPVPGPR